MYAEGGYTMISGVLLSLGFIALGVWYFNKMIDSSLDQKAWLTRFISLLLAAMLGLFMVDKLVSFKTKLWKKVQRIGLVAGALGAAIIAAPIALPAALVTGAGYFVAVGTVTATLSQLTKEDK
jgi:hypothetical protein